MNKLLMVSTIPGTLSTFLLPFARHFRDQGWRVDAMAYGVSTDAKCLQGFNQVWEVEWSRNPLHPRNLVAAPPVIREVIECGSYDIVHVHTPVAAFVTRYALRNLRKQARPQLIYTAHGFHFYQGGKPLKNAVFITLEKLAGSWTDHLVVINREDQEAAKRYRLISPEFIHYMPGIGVDVKYYSRDMTPEAEVERVRQELGLTQETPLLLSVAELNPGKRHRDILRALALLARPNVCIAFAGTGPLLEELQQLASQLGVQNQVRFLGYRQDITALISASVATVLASEREGLPRSVMESLCLETPVIGTSIRGIQDLLQEGCGLLVKVGDVEGLTVAIAHLLDHPEEARIMGKRGREHIAAFDLQHILRLHENLYTEAIKEIKKLTSKRKPIIYRRAA